MHVSSQKECKTARAKKWHFILWVPRGDLVTPPNNGPETSEPTQLKKTKPVGGG